MTFKNANEAFEYYLNEIRTNGEVFAGTKALFNVNFKIENPADYDIVNEDRKWLKKYAEAEFEWYINATRSIDDLGKIYGRIPPIWENMADYRREVNSNYGWQWSRDDQFANVIMDLYNPETRQATLSIYDAKEKYMYGKDTPCTYAINFTIVNDRLNMSVSMRSNDLWWGFCNDQYCFARLQMIVSELIKTPLGTYNHYVDNLHLYNNKL